jgi:GH35 family endo-1,4-beta-xylanase
VLEDSCQHAQLTHVLKFLTNTKSAGHPILAFGIQHHIYKLFRLGKREPVFEGIGQVWGAFFVLEDSGQHAQLAGVLKILTDIKSAGQPILAFDIQPCI